MKLNYIILSVAGSLLRLPVKRKGVLSNPPGTLCLLPLGRTAERSSGCSVPEGQLSEKSSGEDHPAAPSPRSQPCEGACTLEGKLLEASCGLGVGNAGGGESEVPG